MHARPRKNANVKQLNKLRKLMDNHRMASTSKVNHISKTAVVLPCHLLDIKPLMVMLKASTLNHKAVWSILSRMVRCQLMVTTLIHPTVNKVKSINSVSTRSRRIAYQKMRPMLLYQKRRPVLLYQKRRPMLLNQKIRLLLLYQKMRQLLPLVLVG